MSSLQQKLENWRLRQHFKRVEAILRKRDVSHLTSTLQQARERYLDYLHAYAERGIFPRNYEQLPYAPCFVDRDGRECAVAHLVMVAGQTKLANDIASAANYAYVPQMAFPELETWAAESGFTKEELALIQPGYWLEFSSGLLSTAVVVWVIGLFTILLNTIRVVRKSTGCILYVFSILVAMVLLLFSLYCLYGGWEAHYVTAPDVPSGLASRALRDVMPLNLLGLISLILTLLSGWLGLSGYIAPDRKRKEDS
jgi:hypothetical protein